MASVSQDPSPQDWGQRYAEGSIPWDVGRAHPELLVRLTDAPLDEPGTALVPGSGLGHDAVALAEAGWQVTAVDFADGISEDVNARLDPFGGRFLHADALELDIEEQFDLVLDHTFFCAINPVRRGDYGALIGRALRPGGSLAAIVFPVGKGLETGGPPWDMSSDDLRLAVGTGFVTEVDEPVGHKVPGRSWEEHWLLLRRK